VSTGFIERFWGRIEKLGGDIKLKQYDKNKIENKNIKSKKHVTYSEYGAILAVGIIFLRVFLMAFCHSISYGVSR